MAETGANRRRCSGVKIAIPVRAAGHTRDGRAWEEIASTEDASLRGLSFRLTTRVEQGELLATLLLLPGETVTVSELGGDFRTEAVARGVYVGHDRVRRVNLGFSTPAPRRLILTSGA